MPVNILLACILSVNAVAFFFLARDFIKHRAEMKAEPGNPLAQFLCTFVVMFLGTFGISDYALFTSIYPKTRWLELKKLPGTLISQCLLYVMIASITYIQGVELQPLLLLCFIGAQALGTVLGVRITEGIRTDVLKKVLAVSLLVAALFILMNLFGIIPLRGTTTSLPPGKLIIASVAAFFMGALKCVGVGSFPLTMAMSYFLELNPLVAYPLMMGAGALSSPVGAIQFIKSGNYMRRLALTGLLAGGAASLIAVNFVKSMDVTALQWIVVVVVLYSAITMLMKGKEKKEIPPMEESD